MKIASSAFIRCKLAIIAQTAQELTQKHHVDPIPSAHPDDPLNWPLAAKITTYGTICLFSFMANVNGSNFTVAVVPLQREFHVTLTRAVFLIAFNVLMFGLGNILWVPMMRVLGKRPVYLLALAVLIAANVWSTRAQSWGSLLGGRMLAGFGASAADATVPSAVADMFFIDQRGHCMMFFHFALASGIFLGPLINAYIVQYHGWRWSTEFIAIAGGVIFMLACFLIRETQYDRSASGRPSNEQSPKRSYAGWLSLTVGFNNDKPLQRFARTLWDILRMAFYPPVLWVGCLIGLFVGWTIIIQTTVANTFLKPPYSWKLGSIGLFSLSGWIGSLLAFYFGGKLTDLIANRARLHDHTVKPRPGKRLIALIVPTVLAPVGLIIFGQCVAGRTHWIGPAFGYAMHSFGFTAVSNIAVTFAVDCYQDFAGEALVTVFVIRNIIAVVCSFYSPQWIAQNGMEKVCGWSKSRLSVRWLTVIGHRHHGRLGMGPSRTGGPYVVLHQQHSVIYEDIRSPKALAHGGRDGLSGLLSAEVLHSYDTTIS